MPDQNFGNIKYAVIPVAGLGTRLLPATKAIPKEMMPLVDKPLIQYVVSEAVSAGIKNIVLVTHSSKNAIENHFDTSFELEATLEKRVKRQLLEDIRSIIPEDVSILNVRQGESKGLAHAIACASPIVGKNPFAVLLPDVLIDNIASDLKTDNLSAMIKKFESTGVPQIMVEKVPKEDVSSYGIVDINGSTLKEGESVKAGDKVSLVGFGTFEVKATAAKTGINPQTKEKITIAASKHAAFSASKALKDALNK